MFGHQTHVLMGMTNCEKNMLPYMLDTNIVSDFIKGTNLPLYRRLKQVLQDQDAVISALMAADDNRRERIDLFLDDVLALTWTAAAADIYGQLKTQLRQQSTPIGELDTEIAVHALAENLVFVTHNTKHFEKVLGLRVKDWLG
jgi:tRNA(fMet)-specific endonuclease VapC